MPARLMIVEDEAVIALDLEARLIRLGYEIVATADDGEAAIAMAVEHHPDLILMDINLSGQVDGIDAARAISEWLDCAVVFLTAFGDARTIGRAAATGAYAYLLKPFDERSLTATVSLALERHARDVRLRTYETATDVAPIGLAVVRSSDGRLERVHSNPFFLEHCEAQIGPLLGEDASDPRPEMRRLRAALTDRSRAAELVIEQVDGVGKALRVEIVPIPGAKGQDDRALVLCTDLSAEYQAQNALSRCQRFELVGRMSAGVAHDFNNLLTMMLAHGEFAREAATDPEQLESLDSLVAAVSRGAALTNRLLSFSRGAPIQSRPADIPQTFERLRNTGRHILGDHIRLIVSMQHDRVHVGLPEVSLEQILLNMLANARDAMPHGGCVFVHSELVEGRAAVRISVRDTGTGMSPEIAARVFEPLFTTKSGAGNGLGLWNARVLVERAGGHISVSTELGVGSSFEVELPTVDDFVPEAVATPTTVEPVYGLNCLVVSRDFALGLLLARVLGQIGFAVESAADPDQAIAAMCRLDYQLDLMVTDEPVSEREESLLEELHVHRPELPAILLANGERERPASHHRHLILEKPFSPRQLAQAATRLVRARPRTDSVQRPGLDSNASSTTSTTASGVEVLVEAVVAETTPILTALEQRGFDFRVIPDPTSMTLTFHGPETRTVVIASQPASSSRATDPPLTWLTMDDPGRTTIDEVLDELERASLELRVARLRARIELIGPGTVEYRTTSSRTRRSLELSLRSLAFDLRPITTLSSLGAGLDGEHAGAGLTRVCCEAEVNSHGPYTSISRLVAAARAIGMYSEVKEAIVRALVGALERDPDPSRVALVDLQPLSLEVCADARIQRLASNLVLLIDEQTLRSQDIARIRALRERGFGLALTAFGAGPLPLDGLVALRPELVILHQGLVEMIGDWQDTSELVGELVELVAHAGGRAFARDVWNRSVASALQALGCGVFVTATANPLRSAHRWSARAS